MEDKANGKIEFFDQRGGMTRYVYNAQVGARFLDGETILAEIAADFKQGGFIKLSRDNNVLLTICFTSEQMPPSQAFNGAVFRALSNSDMVKYYPVIDQLLEQAKYTLDASPVHAGG